MQLLITDLTQEPPYALRAAALFLNTLAADRESGKSSQVSVTVTAPGVSEPIAPPAPSADASQDGDGSQNDNAPEADANGFPWDGRIHSSSKALNKDGTWRYMRGVDKDLVDSIEGEWRAKPAAGAENSIPAAPSSAEAPPAPPSTTAAADVPPPPPPPPPPADAAPVPPAQPAVNSGALFKRINDLKKEGKLDQETIQQGLDSVGLASMAELLKLKDAAKFAELTEVIETLAEAA